MEKPKSKITPIVVPDDKLQFLRNKLDDPDISQSVKGTLSRNNGR